MIYPLLPMRFAGATWYQGEANAGDPQSTLGSRVVCLWLFLGDSAMRTRCGGPGK